MVKRHKVIIEIEVEVTDADQITSQEVADCIAIELDNIHDCTPTMYSEVVDVKFKGA